VKEKTAMGLSVKRWWQERVPVDAEALRHPLREPIPAELKGFFFALGGTPALLFLLQLVTGVLLAFYYVPFPEGAYESIRHITFQVRFGWFVRGIHRLSAHLMMVVVFLHLLRVFFTKAYRRPRELNWIVGVGLGLTTLAFGFTGYSLLYDQLSYWATTVGTNILGELPLVGKPVLYFLRGGREVTANTLTRFYYFHVWLLPLIMSLLIVVHLLLVRLHGVAPLTEGKKERRTYPFFPDHVYLEMIIGLVVLILVVNLVLLFPPGLGQKADPLETPLQIEPEWYFFFVYRWLKLVPLRVGVIGVALFLVGLTFWPFIDAWLERLALRVDIARILGVIVFFLVIAFTLWELFA